ncbi:T9SS type A sorting domain-containing protein [Nostoc ellipsosporum NOK]|nr:T9SS type A sorting domain-containing protein [Nostoc ellipsosporum NOK]
MKLFYLAFFMLVTELVTAQVYPPLSRDTTAKVTLRCRVGEADTTRQPLWIVDGLIVPQSEVARIDPHTIQEIHVLKSDSLSHLYGRQQNGAIIVTLKKNRDVITVVDASTNNAVPGASIRLISEKDSSGQVADGRGQAPKKKLINEGKYTIQVTAIGYQPVTLALTDGGIPDTISMQPKAICEEEVVVTSNVRRIKCYQTCGMVTTVVNIDAVQEPEIPKVSSTFSAYPNPLIRGQQQTIEWTAAKTASYTLQVFDQGGKIVWRTNIRAKEGLNRYAWQPQQQWAAGAYILRLSSVEDKYVASCKIIRL